MIGNSPPENLRSSSSVSQYQNIMCCKSSPIVIRSGTHAYGNRSSSWILCCVVFYVCCRSSSCVADCLQSSSPIFFAAIDYSSPSSLSILPMSQFFLSSCFVCDSEKVVSSLRARREINLMWGCNGLEHFEEDLVPSLEWAF
ncbi:hypothetical protein MRB53_028155 [Persea americana]|uniref:Uncharacterized protein n=1 Tax=Persea americana TaxID=3435 RepID=A0ACC2KF37_PERAE|nr:hypothetical protein MRB53_028155 [Persea americana]